MLYYQHDLHGGFRPPLAIHTFSSDLLSPSTLFHLNHQIGEVASRIEFTNDLDPLAISLRPIAWHSTNFAERQYPFLPS